MLKCLVASRKNDKQSLKAQLNLSVKPKKAMMTINENLQNDRSRVVSCCSIVHVDNSALKSECAKINRFNHEAVLQ